MADAIQLDFAASGSEVELPHVEAVRKRRFMSKEAAKPRGVPQGRLLARYYHKKYQTAILMLNIKTAV